MRLSVMQIFISIGDYFQIKDQHKSKFKICCTREQLVAPKLPRWQMPS